MMGLERNELVRTAYHEPEQHRNDPPLLVKPDHSQRSVPKRLQKQRAATLIERAAATVVASGGPAAQITGGHCVQQAKREYVHRLCLCEAPCYCHRRHLSPAVGRMTIDMAA